MAAKPKNQSDKKPAAPLLRVERALTLAAQTERALREAIDNSVFVGNRLPSLVDLAEQLGVSRETVRLAAERLQQEGLLVKHRRRGTFARPPQSAVQLQAVPSSVIGYVHADYSCAGDTGEAVTRGQGGMMLEGAVLEAGRHGYQLLVHNATVLQLRGALEAMTHASRLRGIVLASVAEEKFVRRLAGLKLPAVLVDHDLHVPQLTTLRTDSAGAASLAVEHLWALGHRRIACAYWNQAELNPWFVRGYREAMRAAGARPRRAWELPVELTPSGADDCVARWLAISPRPTALVTFNNSLAEYVFQSALRRGISVPNELSIFGGGGEEALGLTCAQLDWRELGRQSIRLLTGLLAGATAQHHLAPYRLQVGRTTGPVTLVR